jgi:molybdate transport system substrate-binding protein
MRLFREWQGWLAFLLALAVPGFLAEASAAPAAAPQQIVVLAAASLTNVLPEIGKSYEAAMHQPVIFSFAGSMALAKQIEASAGADAFISADVESMNYLDMRGLIAKGTRRDLLANSLVLVAPADSKTRIAIGPGFALARALMGGRLALADPDSVPAGRYGKEALTALGVWNSVAGHLAQGEDVRAALAYVARGEAPLGIVYATDARAEPGVRVVGTFPPGSHKPILYPSAALRGAKPGTQRFLDYLHGAAARAVFTKAGFRVLPAR